MRDCRIDFDTKEIEGMVRMLNKLGASPQKAVSRAAGRAGTVLKRRVKSEIHSKSGNLKKAIIRIGEKNHGKRGKKYYQITFDRKMNEVLQKPIQRPGLLGGKNKHAYYPFSVEFGFLAMRTGGGYVYYDKDSGQLRWNTVTEATPKPETEKVEGQHFLRNAADNVSPEVHQILVDKTMEELEKIWLSTK